MRLSRCDLEGALGFLREAGESDVVEPFSSALLSRLAALVRCHDANYAEIDRVRRRTTFFASGDGIQDEDEQASYWATVDEHPIRQHRTRTGDLGAFKISDFVSPKRLRQMRFYNDYFRLYLPSEYLMSLSLPAPAGHTRTFSMAREDHDFGERERTLLNLLQPHLHQLRLVAGLRERALKAIHIGIDNGVLTERETEVLHHVANGMRNHEVAQALWIAPGTVKKHLDNIYAKLGVRDRTSAVTRLHQRERSV